MTGKAGRRGWGNLRKLPSGRWQASYLGPDGHRHKADETFSTKSEGAYWLEGQRSAIDVGKWKPAPPPVKVETFADYSAAWMAGRELRPKTREGYESILRRFLLPTFGPVLLTEVTAPAVRVWWAGMDPDHPAMRARSYSLLRTIFATAVTDDLLPASPCRIRKGGTERKAHKSEPATVAELATITAAMPERYRAAVTLAAWCALRFGELAELRRSDVVGDVLRIRRATVELDSGERVIGRPKSDAGIRDVTMPPHVVPIMAAHMLRWSQPGADGLVFTSPDGRRHVGDVLGYHYRRARVKAGRPDLRWHDLRHTGLTMAARTGATLRELMSRAGHSTPAAALIYQHAARGRDAEIAAALSRLADPGVV